MRARVRLSKRVEYSQALPNDYTNPPTFVYLSADTILVHLRAPCPWLPTAPNATSAIKRMVKPLVGTLPMSYNIDYVNLERGRGSQDRGDRGGYAE